jgi:tyrosyl-tRNA synthetase
MSKSYGNAINILDTPDDLYGKSMRISDDLLPAFIDLATDLPPAEAEALKARLKQHGVNPMEIKKEVAANLVRQYCGAAEAEAAVEHFRLVVQEKEIPEEVPEIRLPAQFAGKATPWTDLLPGLECEGKKLAASKSEVRRLIQQGGFYVEQETIKDTAAAYSPAPVTLIRLGKRRFFRILG